MKYNYHELDREDQWTIVELVTLAKINAGNIDVKNIDITLVVNDREIDILAFTHRHQEQMDRWVYEEARSMVRSLGSDLTDAIEEVLIDRLDDT